MVVKLTTADGNPVLLNLCRSSSERNPCQSVLPAKTRQATNRTQLCIFSPQIEEIAEIAEIAEKSKRVEPLAPPRLSAHSAVLSLLPLLESIYRCASLASFRDVECSERLIDRVSNQRGLIESRRALASVGIHETNRPVRTRM